VAVTSGAPTPDADASSDDLTRSLAALTAEIADLKLELWSARDAAMGAVAQAGTLRARNAELEALIHQLRVEVDRLAHVEHSVTYRIGDRLVRPLRAARRLAR